jgi:predicted amidohydrolase YtcJ
VQLRPTSVEYLNCEDDMRRIILLALAILPLTQCDHQQAQWHPFADVIFINGNVVTMDGDFSMASALATKDGKIIAVGTDDQITPLAGDSTRLVNLEGKTLIPGLQDSHIHFLGLGHDIKYEADLTFARNSEEILQEVTNLKQRLNPEPGAWIVGNRWDQYKYPQMLTRWQLDEIAPENPVRLDRVYRGVAVNTEVFRLMGIHDNRPATWPSWWLKDPGDFTFEDKIYRAKRSLRINGEERELSIPTGVFIGSKATSLVRTRRAGRNFEEDVESVKYGCEEMLRLGVTSIVDPSSGMGYNMRVYQEAYNRNWLKTRVSAVYEGTFYTNPPEAIREHLDGIKINNLGNSFLRWRGTKFYSDGGAGTRSAWLSEPFARSEELEGSDNFGNPVVRDNAEREAQYRAAVEFGWDLHTHCCGDQAMRQTTDLYMKLTDEIRKTRPDADLRWSIIHAYLPIEEKTRVLEDMAEYGIIACTNPVFNWQEGAAFANNLGPERLARTQPFRSYHEGGVIMASGSDYPVTSHDPWIGIYALLTRRDQTSGNVYGPEETLDIEQAMRAYTINGAYLTYEEAFKGSLEVGKVADLVILDLQDIRELERNPELCLQLGDKVLLTMVDGQVQYQRVGFAF